jgi:hypothetical protein
MTSSSSRAAAASVLSVIEKTADRIGPAPPKFRSKSRPQHAGDMFIRENMFLQSCHIGEAAISELYELMALLPQSVPAVDIIVVQVEAPSIPNGAPPPSWAILSSRRPNRATRSR